MFRKPAKSQQRDRTARVMPIAACALMSFFSAASALALEGEPERQFVLEGLQGVHVSVPAVTGIDVDRGAITSAVEQKITASGMKAIGDKEYLNNTDVKSLVVRFIPFKNGGKTYFSLNLDLTQMIYLPDRDSRKVDVSMWDDVSVGVLESSKSEHIQDAVLKRVDKFIDMWRRANGKSNN